MSNTAAILQGATFVNQTKTESDYAGVFNDTADDLVIGLYFSASWCGPCRNFTPLLTRLYNGLNESKKQLEVVFLSRDSDLPSFNKYFGKMPWIAMKHDSTEIAQLASKFSVSGIPTLVLVDKEGNVLCKDAVSALRSDETGTNFPWKPRAVKEILADATYTDGPSTLTSTDVLDGKEVLGLYFSASWCGPCRNFTPTLVNTYNKLSEAGKPFEILFVSSDRDESSFSEYFGKMPWKAIKFGDSAIEELGALYEKRGIPYFVLIDLASGDIITTNGRGAVSADPECAKYPWYPPPIYSLDGAPGSVLNEKQVALAIQHDMSDEVIEQLESVAVAHIAALNGAEQELYFVYAKEGPMLSRIAGFLGIDPKQPTLALLNIGAQKKYVSVVDSVTADGYSVLVASADNVEYASL